MGKRCVWSQRRSLPRIAEAGISMHHTATWLQRFTRSSAEAMGHVEKFAPCPRPRDAAMSSRWASSCCSGRRGALGWTGLQGWRHTRDGAHSTAYTIHDADYTVHIRNPLSFTLLCFAVHSTQYTVHSTQFAVHSSQFTVHSTQYTVHRQPSQHSTPYTVSPANTAKQVHMYACKHVSM